MERRGFLQGVLGTAAVAVVPLPAPVNPTVKALLAGEVVPWSGVITASEIRTRMEVVERTMQAAMADFYENFLLRYAEFTAPAAAAPADRPPDH